jgi:hypothetical protein
MLRYMDQRFTAIKRDNVTNQVHVSARYNPATVQSQCIVFTWWVKNYVKNMTVYIDMF